MHAGDTDTLYDAPDSPDLTDTTITAISVTFSPPSPLQQETTPPPNYKRMSPSTPCMYSQTLHAAEKETPHFFTGNTPETLHAAEKKVPELSHLCMVYQEQ
jgi:hypothetical protein